MLLDAPPYTRGEYRGDMKVQGEDGSIRGNREYGIGSPYREPYRDPIGAYRGPIGAYRAPIAYRAP